MAGELQPLGRSWPELGGSHGTLALLWLCHGVWGPQGVPPLAGTAGRAHAVRFSEWPSSKAFLSVALPSLPRGGQRQEGAQQPALCAGDAGGQVFPTLPTGPASPAPPQSSPGMGWCKLGGLGTPKQELIVFCSSSSLPRALGRSLPRGCPTGTGRDRDRQGQGQAGLCAGRGLGDSPGSRGLSLHVLLPPRVPAGAPGWDLVPAGDPAAAVGVLVQSSDC